MQDYSQKADENGKIRSEKTHKFKHPPWAEFQKKWK
jgi:hypothetical protein